MSETNEIIALKDQKNNIDELLQTQNSISPVVDIYETDNDFILVANMPGVARRAVQVKLNDNTLVLFGRIDYENAVNRKYILNENEIGNYFRKFKISDSIDVNKIEAKYDNGQLLLTLTKHEKAKPRTIDIV